MNKQKLIFNVFLSFHKPIVSCILLCSTLFWLETTKASVETFLAEQEVTISGKVVAPSCQASLDTKTINFSRAEITTDASKNKMSVGVNVGNRKNLFLHLSECDFDGLGIMFKSEVLPGYQERGVLRVKADNSIATGSYYTIEPGSAVDNPGKDVFSLASDSASFVNDSNGHRYFMLNQQEYWVDVSASLTDGKVMIIPFEVAVHKLDDKASRVNLSRMEGRFTLQVSYR
ncbi:hypothetical protein QUR14_004366 [Enterobacter hormaechei]|nr:hypothetical protein [Enterobacter hormaechei]HBC0589356.1 hypothetical protein [Enterobacter cloacae]